MNKKNKILVGCLALLLVLSVGYALFSETITINGTATAKGSLDLTLYCQTGAGYMADFNIEASASCNIDGNTITTTSILPKPSENTFFYIVVQNTGTIPAVLKKIDSPNTHNIDRTTVGDEVYYDDRYELLGKLTIMDKNGNFTNMYSTSEIEAANITIQPDETIAVLIFHEWLSSYTGEGVTMPKDGVTMNYNVTLGFEQVAN